MVIAGGLKFKLPLLKKHLLSFFVITLEFMCYYCKLCLKYHVNEIWISIIDLLYS